MKWCPTIKAPPVKTGFHKQQKICKNNKFSDNLPKKAHRTVKLRRMATIKRTSSAGALLALAVLAAMAVSRAAALPVRITRQEPDTQAYINQVQMDLKSAINALYLIIDPFSLMINACQLWETMPKAAPIDTDCGNSSNNSTSNVTLVVEEHIRNVTCHKISAETGGFNLTQEDGSCSGVMLDYLCDRHLQKVKSYSLFDMIDVDMENFPEWASQHFDEALANRLSDLYK